MKTKTPLNVTALASVFSLTIGVSVSSLGQVDTSGSLVPVITGSSTAGPTSSFQVLRQKRVNLGSRSIIYNLVAPPVLPKRVPAPVLTPAALTPEEEQTELLREQKDWQQFCFSATIYGHRVTEIAWGGNNQYRAFSNIDFNQFCFTQNVETETTIYELYFMAFNESTESEPEEAQVLLTSLAFPSNRFGYILDPSYPVPPAEALAALDAVHAYYNANSAKLAADYAKSVAEQHARERWQKSHPSVPKDTVVNFWPIKSSVYLGSGTKGGEK